MYNEWLVVAVLSTGYVKIKRFLRMYVGCCKVHPFKSTKQVSNNFNINQTKPASIVFLTTPLGKSNKKILQPLENIKRPDVFKSKPVPLVRCQPQQLLAVELL